MANLFSKTWKRFRQPLACFGVVAAGCFAVDRAFPNFITAQETGQPSAALEALFSSDDFQISPIPKLTPAGQSHQNSGFSTSTPLRSATANSGTAGSSSTAFQGSSSGESVHQIIRGGVPNRSVQSNAADTSARVVLPPNPVHGQRPAGELKTAVWRQPMSANRPGSAANNFASQASFQQHAGDEAQPNQQASVSTFQSGERVAEMRRENLPSSFSDRNAPTSFSHDVPIRIGDAIDLGFADVKIFIGGRSLCAGRIA